MKNIKKQIYKKYRGTIMYHAYGDIELEVVAKNVFDAEAKLIQKSSNIDWGRRDLRTEHKIVTTQQIDDE